MNYAYEMPPKKVNYTENAKAKGRMLMARQGNTSKIVLSFLFCLVAAMLALLILDAVCTYLLPERLAEPAMVLSAAFAIVVYFMADVMLVRLGVRMGRGRAELFDFGKKGNGSGFAASAAMGLGVLTELAVFALFYVYVEFFSDSVFRVLGEAVYGLCMLLVVFLVLVLVLYISTSLFFLPAVAERERKGLFGLISASARAASGNRWKIVKFVLSFAFLTALSLLSLGILFCVYVVPFYILSYGAFASEVLDDKEI